MHNFYSVDINEMKENSVVVVIVLLLDLKRREKQRHTKGKKGEASGLASCLVA